MAWREEAEAYARNACEHIAVAREPVLSVAKEGDTEPVLSVAK